MLSTIQKNTVEFVRLSRLYTSRCAAQPAFAGYPTLDVLVTALQSADEADADRRRSLLCAVIADHKGAPSPLGAAIVLHAFRGMLAKLSRSLFGVDDRDEADARVTAGLLEGLKRVRPERDPDRIAMYVRQETRRAVFAALRKDGRARPRKPKDKKKNAMATGAPQKRPDGDLTALGDVELLDDLDAQVDPASLVPLEDRMAAQHPTLTSVSDEQILLAHGVRGGLRQLTEHVFEQADARRRRAIYQSLWRRTQKLVAGAK